MKLNIINSIWLKKGSDAFFEEIAVKAIKKMRWTDNREFPLEYSTDYDVMLHPFIEMAREIDRQVVDMMRGEFGIK
jgi:hypothetical protein